MDQCIAIFGIAGQTMKFDLCEILRRSRCLLVFILLWLTPGTPTNGEELTTAAAVRGLTVKQAQQPMRVHLRGVVIFFDESLYERFIQDDTAGIYLQASTNTPPLIPGQVVDVEGVSSPGEYAPIIVPEKGARSGGTRRGIAGANTRNLRTSCQRPGGQPVRRDHRRCAIG